MTFDPYLRPECPCCGERIPWKTLRDRHRFSCPACRGKLCSTYRVWEQVLMVPVCLFLLVLPAAESFAAAVAYIVGVVLATVIAHRLFGRLRECER